jgi:cysteine synthase A
VVDPAAAAHFDEIISDAAQPVVIFALEWCEFAGGVKHLLTRLQVPFRAIHLDGPEFEDHRWANQVRRAVADRAGAVTIPQVFIGGTHVGGATETFDAANDGRLRELLAGVGIEADPASLGDAYIYLPKWIHPRGAAAARKPSAA